MKKHLDAYVFLFVFLSVSSISCKKSFECADSIGCVDIAPGEAIKIGAIQDLSGGAASIGITQIQGIQLAILQKNELLLNHPVQLHIEDGGCTPEGGSNAALKLSTRPKLVGIVGTTCSGSAVNASQIMAEAGLVMISGTNAASSLTAVGDERGSDWRPGYFRTMYNTAEMGRAAAIFVFQELRLTQAVTINDGDILTRQLTTVFERVFTELGGTITLSTGVNKGDKDMRPLLTAIAASQTEFVFMPIFPSEGSLILNQAKTIPELNELLFMGEGALLSEPFLDSVKGNGVGMYFVSPPTIESAANNTFIHEYEAEYGEPPRHFVVSYSYDAVNMLLLAIEDVAVQESEGTLHIGRQALRDRLYSMSEFEGLTGRLACNAFGDCGTVRFNVMRLDDPASGIDELKKNIVYTYTPDRGDSRTE